MKRQKVTKILGALCLCFAVAGGVSAITANAAGEGVVSIESGVLKIDGAEVTAATANFKTWEKASVRYDGTVDAATGKEYTGMRFLSWINQDVYDALMASPDYTVSFGTLIANEATVTPLTDFTKQYLPANTDSATYYKDAVVENVVAEENEKSGQTGVVEFSAVMYGTTGAENFTKERMARAYMTVTSVADASQTVTIYANYNAEESRSIANVAMGALQANDYDKTDADEKEFKALTTYAKVSSSWKTGYDYMRYISTFDELKAYAASAGTYIVMKNDISAMDVAWVKKTGYPTAGITELNAALDGNGKTLTVDMAYCLAGTYWKYGNASVFGIIGENSVVRNLVYNGNVGRPELSDASQTTYGRAAGFANRNDGVIENCYLKAEVLSGLSPADSGNAVGMLQLNTGTIQSVISDLRVFSKGGYGGEDARKYGIAVANNGGTIKNSVSINSTSLWKISSDIDMLNGSTIGDENRAYTFGNYLNYSQYSGLNNVTYLPSNFRDYKCPADAGRSDCYTFASLEALLSGTGKGDAEANNNATTYETVEAATAQTALELGGKWSFDVENNMIKLGNTIVFECLGYTQGTLSWKTDGAATVSVNGTQVATTEAQKYDIASYFKNNIDTLEAGDVEVAVTIGDRVLSDTLTIAKVGTLADLKTAAANEKAYIYLTQDIDLSGASWTGDGTTAPGSVIPELNAVIEGNGYKLFGLQKTADVAPVHNVGFIGRIKSGAKVENVIFVGSLGYKADGTTVKAIRARTGIFAWENAGLIKNCYIKGEIYTPWAYGNSTMYTLIGAVYKNKGTMESVVTDISVQTPEWSADANPCKFGFAVFNTGTVKNSVTISSAQRTITGGTQQGWMSSDADEAFGLEGASGEFGTSIWNGTGGWKHNVDVNIADAGRENCYLFTSYLQLISGSGYGDKFDGDVFDKTAYATVDAATVKLALGSAWTYDADNGDVKLCGRSVNNAGEPIMGQLAFDAGDVKMIAHRGLVGNELENTIPAFKAAGEAGYYGIEGDLQVTKDGKYVMSHNDSLLTPFGVDKKVSELTFDELRSLTLYERYGVKDEDTLIVPTLEEYINICKEYGMVAYLELKSELTVEQLTEVVNAVKTCEWFDNTVFISYKQNNMINVRTVDANAKAMWIIENPTSDNLTWLVENQVGLCVGYWSCSQSIVDTLHEAGLTVNAWTVDSLEKAEQMKLYGVDTITTNYLIDSAE